MFYTSANLKRKKSTNLETFPFFLTISNNRKPNNVSTSTKVKPKKSLKNLAINIETKQKNKAYQGLKTDPLRLQYLCPRPDSCEASSPNAPLSISSRAALSWPK